MYAAPRGELIQTLVREEFVYREAARRHRRGDPPHSLPDNIAVMLELLGRTHDEARGLSARAPSPYGPTADEPADAGW
ncbi:MAG TPA: hypothetical protein VF591_22065 [Pyrinomonadaceae bacterium]|jgi:hypothetical protein